FTSNIQQLAWHAIKVIVSFAMLERRQIARADFPAFVLGLPFAVDVNARFLDLPAEQWVAKVERDLLLVNALRLDNGMIVAG
ncbi:MAG TPA: MBL fold metallo-hydrolase, partial [Azonexus sp.]|nr:MBL fold metallo-hydrolase [Azonexus sp.]